MASPSRTLSAVLEVLTQHRALARAKELSRSDDRRSAWRRAREQQDVAELLWPSGRHATALRAAVDALGAYELALDADPDDDASMAEAGLTPAEVATLRRARTVRAASAPLPAEDDALATTHAGAFADLVEACETIDAHLAFELRSPLEVRVSRVARVGVVALASLVVGALLAAAWTLPVSPAVSIGETPVYGDDQRYAAELAVDGDPTTEWVLPDAQTGTLDVHFSPGREVRRVKLWNGHNYAFGDRGVAGFRIELWSFARRVAAVEGALPQVRTATAPPVVVPIVGHHVDRLRFVALSWHVHGAALAELEVE